LLGELGLRTSEFSYNFIYTSAETNRFIPSLEKRIRFIFLVLPIILLQSCFSSFRFLSPLTRSVIIFPFVAPRTLVSSSLVRTVARRSPNFRPRNRRPSLDLARAVPQSRRRRPA
jgi:hypothetical protein